MKERKLFAFLFSAFLILAEIVLCGFFKLDSIVTTTAIVMTVTLNAFYTGGNVLKSWVTSKYFVPELFNPSDKNQEQQAFQAEP